MASKDYIKANELVDKLIKDIKYTKSECSSLFYLKGLIEYRQKLYDNAINSFDNSLLYRPSLVSAYIALSKIYNIKKRNYKKAISLANQALLLDSYSYYAHITLGYANRNIAYFENQPEYYDNALKHVKKAIEINPDLDAGYHTLASIHFMKLEYIEAKKWYVISLENNLKEWEYQEWTFICIFTIDLILDRKLSRKFERDYLNLFSKGSEYFSIYLILQLLGNILEDKYINQEEIQKALQFIGVKNKRNFFFLDNLKNWIKNDIKGDKKEKLEYVLDVLK